MDPGDPAHSLKTRGSSQQAFGVEKNVVISPTLLHHQRPFSFFLFFFWGGRCFCSSWFLPENFPPTFVPQSGAAIEYRRRNNERKMLPLDRFCCVVIASVHCARCPGLHGICVRVSPMYLHAVDVYPRCVCAYRCVCVCVFVQPLEVCAELVLLC